MADYRGHFLFDIFRDVSRKGVLFTRFFNIMWTLPTSFISQPFSLRDKMSRGARRRPRLPIPAFPRFDCSTQKSKRRKAIWQRSICESPFTAVWPARTRPVWRPKPPNCAGKVDVVLVKNLSRIGREWGIVQSYIDLLNEHKVKLLCVSEGLEVSNRNLYPFFERKKAECP